MLIETRQVLIHRETEITGQIKIEIQNDERGFYLIINGLEIGDYYRSMGINCSAGRFYCQTLYIAQGQADAEIRHFLETNSDSQI